MPLVKTTIQSLAESARQKTRDAELHYYPGMANYQLKQRTESREALQHALDLNLPMTLAGEANRVLKELR